jgi:glycerophosphoryl diester phosphodiesterase
MACIISPVALAISYTDACRGLIDGATTLELDNGITLDGEVVVWHDQQIKGSKCQDTAPAVGPWSTFRPPVIDNAIEQFPEDPMYPYVGKYIANLTLAQVKTLDCGSKRQDAYRKTLILLQVTLLISFSQQCN